VRECPGELEHDNQKEQPESGGQHEANQASHDGNCDDRDPDDDQDVHVALPLSITVDDHGGSILDCSTKVFNYIRRLSDT
jgi:hypothetical protein